jgi:hypothetical protein
MVDDRHDDDELAGPSPNAPEIPREEQERRALALSDEIARKYTREALSRFVVDGAGTGEKLDAHLKSEMERRLGGDFGNVRIFRGPFAEAVTRHHKADAVTIANTGMILVREGPRANVQTAQGKALLAHELTHVKQAQQGLHFSKDGGDNNAPLEKEAHAAEAATYAEESGQGGGAAGGKGGASAADVERLIIEKTIELIERNEELERWRSGVR